MLIGVGRESFAQGYRAAEAAQKMTPGPGLAVELVASEPLVRQPVAIDFDDRGRLWVVQYLQYPNPEGLKPAKVDRFSRTTYDRMPEPPPKGPRGSDRITILEDTDGDGRCDRAKDFATGLNLTAGLAFGHGGVFVLQVPYLLFYADRNRDDIPDGDPEVLLSGFGMEDAHSIANSLTWGPDGWLYGCQGSTVTAKIRGVEFQQGIWRYHPLTKRFELFCEGGGNSWGLDFDRHGNLCYSTNHGGFVMLHGVQGGYYWKLFGKHGALHNPYAYGYFDHVPHKNFQGGHVTVGGIFYRADLLPPMYRDKYVGADLLGHAVYWHDMSPRGSTFATRHGGLVAAANDTWFAPSDVSLGPDGGIYVADWHDKRTAHPDPKAEWDSTNGRVYRIVPAGFKRAAGFDIAKKSTPELIELLTSRNHWYTARARRLLAERRDKNAIGPLEQLVLGKSKNDLQLEAFWALYVSGGFDARLAEKLLRHPNADIRAWTVRLLGDERSVPKGLAPVFAKLAASDPSMAVRTQLAATAKRLPSPDALPIIAGLIKREGDVNDPYQPLLVWWAVEQHAMPAMDRLVSLFSSAEAWASPLAKTAVLPRLMRRYATAGTAQSYSACTKLLRAAPADVAPSLLAEFELGLTEQSGVAQSGADGHLFSSFAVAHAAGPSSRLVKPIPAELKTLLQRLWTGEPRGLELMRVMARLGSDDAQHAIIERAASSGAAVEERVGLIRLLGETSASMASGILLRIVVRDEPDALKEAALDALGRLDEPAIATSLIKEYPKLPPDLKTRVCDLLLARKTWAFVLLKATDDGQIPAADLKVEQLRQTSLHDDPQLDAIVRKNWGSIKSGTPEEKLNEMRRMSNDLRVTGGQPLAGREVFRQKCAVCHQLYGEGTAVGPELTHTNRKDRDYLLVSIIDPSAVVRKEYMNYIVETSGGRVLTGLLGEQNASSVTLIGQNAARTVLARSEIGAMREAPVSLMPENLLSDIKSEQLRNLFSYLQSDQPPK